MSTAKDYLPRGERDLRDWAVSYCGHLVSAPLSYGSTAPVAAALQALTDSFGDLIAECTDPATRTPGKLSAKLTAKRALVSAIRSSVRTVQGYPPLTLEQRRDLGINLRDNTGTPVNAPTVKPEMSIVKSDGRRFDMAVKQIGIDSKAKLPRTAGAVVFTWVGPTPNEDISKWEYQGLVSRGNFTVELPLSVPVGSNVWFISAWQTSRGLNGPLSTAISGYVTGALGDSAPATLPIVDGQQATPGEAKPAQLKAA